jgi:RimJ/RimL family protein N-acetyltransferase
MSTALQRSKFGINLTSTPAFNDLRYWWEARQADPDSMIAFTDDAPQTFAQLLDCINTQAYLFYLAFQEDVVVGAMWLHDIVWGEKALPRAGWLGAYVMPVYRGSHMTLEMWTLFRRDLTERGVQSIYIASHYANTRACMVAERHLGFYPVDIFPAFALCQGKETDFFILSMREEDKAEAWALAYERAMKQVDAKNIRTSDHVTRRPSPLPGALLTPLMQSRGKESGKIGLSNLPIVGYDPKQGYSSPG